MPDWKHTLALSIVLLGGAAHADEKNTAPYAGAQTREIASLSESDLAELQAGAGWGLALPAELNGVPGPTHLLELSDEIGLTDTQIADLTDIRDRMRAAAITAGEAFIASEKALSDAFADGVPDASTLAELIEASGQARATLRYTHLSAHLETVPLLTDDQIAKYNVLRGYHSADPCDNVPEGHDATMWRRHNGCD